MDWTDDAIARLRTLWAEGLSTAEIGRRLGVSKNAIVGKAHRLNLPARPSPIIRKAADDVASRRIAPRRVSGPTLSALATAPADAPIEATAPAVTQAPAPRPVPSHPALRAVSSAPRPASPRFSACCWPIGEPGTPSFHFCGDPALANKPYCADHAALAYVRVRDRREDAA